MALESSLSPAQTDKMHAVCEQVRSFAKEETCCERYEATQGKTLRWGIKSAVAGAIFFAFNYIFATGAPGGCSLVTPQAH